MRDGEADRLDAGGSCRIPPVYGIHLNFGGEDIVRSIRYEAPDTVDGR